MAENNNKTNPPEPGEPQFILPEFLFSTLLTLILAK